MSNNVSRETPQVQTHRLSADAVITSFSAEHPPILEVTAGDLVTVETADCFSGQIQDPATLVGDIDRSGANPATGPIAVQGIRPGDTLAVDVIDLRPASRGVTATAPGMGILGDIVPAARTHIVPVEGGVVHIGAATVPFSPMIGVIGVAPERGAVSTVVPGPHGGNLDTLLISKGSTVYLPVFHDGALLAMGDMHAAMGDGEVSGTGIEVSGTVTVRLRTVRQSPLAWPWLETPHTWAVMVSGTDLTELVRLASKEMVDFLSRRLECDFVDAYMVCGAAMRLAICQVVNPLFTLRAEIPKSVAG